MKMILSQYETTGKWIICWIFFDNLSRDNCFFYFLPCYAALCNSLLDMAGPLKFSLPAQRDDFFQSNWHYNIPFRTPTITHRKWFVKATPIAEESFRQTRKMT